MKKQTTLAEAQALSVKLASATETLNAKLREVETLLVSFNLGVTASVPLGDNGNTTLLFEKHAKGTWGLFISYESGEVVPLVNASRKWRIAASLNLSRLLDEIIAEVGLQTERVDDGCRHLEGVIKELQGERR